ncbi:MAG: LPS export ABC transporter periplasmic protein LptC [Chromatiales bacterium]
MLNTRNSVLLLLLLAVATGWLLQRLSSEEGAGRALKAHEPDYYMEDFTQSRMNERGQLHHRLTAELMLHYPDDDSTELVRPVLAVYNEAPTPWQVRAEKGWVSADSELVLLTGEVHIWRDGANGERELDVLTRDLRVRPRERYAETDKPARIHAPGVLYNAVGMRAIFKENRLELLSRVRGRHEPGSENS